MRNLFSAPINGHHYLKRPFKYICGVFSGDGAVQVIQRANEIPLATYFPIRFNGKGEPSPLWRNYLLIEFREGITINVCRTTSNFIKIVTERDEDGLSHPVLVSEAAIQQSMAMVLAGKYNERQLVRAFYGRGSLVRVIEGTFIDQKVRLEEDLFPDMRGNHKVKVDINGIKGVIEVYKLAL
jgi:transcription antitermination factor NusG